MEVETTEENVNVTCGVCGNTFKKIEDLEKHIDTEHSNKKVVSHQHKLSSAKEGGWKCNLCGDVQRTSRELKLHKSRKECSALKEVTNNEEQKSSKESSKPAISSTKETKMNFSSSWQQSDSRNWAAEFGYRESNVVGQKSSVKPNDILSAMKLNFGVSKTGDDCSEDEDEEFDEDNLPGMKESRNKIQNREPRVLSESSRQTRKRLELLTKQAQEKMKGREKNGKKKSKPSPTKPRQDSRPVNNNDSSEDEDLNADINNKDDLLIPLANGWVCEKTRDKTTDSYTTHFWSPEGNHFKSLADIKAHAAKNKIKLNMEPFKAANIDMTKENDKEKRLETVRVKDEETGLPMVIIFPGGSDCLTMDVSATV